MERIVNLTPVPGSPLFYTGVYTGVGGKFGDNIPYTNSKYMIVKIGEFVYLAHLLNGKLHILNKIDELTVKTILEQAKVPFTEEEPSMVRELLKNLPFLHLLGDKIDTDVKNAIDSRLSAEGFKVFPGNGN